MLDGTPSPEAASFLAQHLDKVIEAVVGLVFFSAGYATLRQRVNSLCRRTEALEGKVDTHQGNTTIHVDAVRDAEWRASITSGMKDLGGKLDRLIEKFL